MTSGPAVVFYLDDNNYETEVDGIIGEIVRLSADDPPFLLVRSGLLLTLGNQVTSTLYTAKTDEGRLWTGSTMTASPALERQQKKELLDNLTFVTKSPEFTLRSTLGVSYFCLSFSDIDVSLLHHAIINLGLGPKVSALATFDSDNAVCHRALWRRLTLSHILTAGYVLESLEEAMIDFGFDEGGLHNADWANGSRPWPNPGFFSDELGEGAIFVERRLVDLPLPPDLTTPSQQGRVRNISPVERAITLAPAKIKKINTRDDPSKLGFFHLEDPRWQWPDPHQAYEKMIGYCLKVGHEQKKWLGFRAIGWSAARPGDAWYLANALCSSLVRGPFTPFDTKVSADGTLEFAVNVVIPCPGGKFRNVCAAWNVKAGHEISLSSAYVSEPGARPAALVVQPPARVADSDDWGDVLEWAVSFAGDYAHEVAPDTAQAGGHLWLPHADPAARSLATWCRRSTEQATSIAQRKAWGGRCTQLLSPFGFMGVSKTVASLRAMQYCLGVMGVRSMIEVTDD